MVGYDWVGRVENVASTILDWHRQFHNILVVQGRHAKAEPARSIAKSWRNIGISESGMIAGAVGDPINKAKCQSTDPVFDCAGPPLRQGLRSAVKIGQKRLLVSLLV